MDTPINPEFEATRQHLLTNAPPTSNYESAVYLIQNSETTKVLPEIEKEVKLANLDKEDREIILSLIASYQDQFFLRENYLKCYAENLQLTHGKDLPVEVKTELKAYWDHFQQSLFDGANHIRRVFARAVVSRAKDGFERNAQNTVISSQNYNGLSPEMAMMGGMSPQRSMLKRTFGGFR